jgi:hypothetical protein
MKISQRMELSTHVFLTLALDGDGEGKKEREREKKGGGGNRADPTGGLHAAVNKKLLPLILIEPWSSSL